MIYWIELWDRWNEMYLSILTSISKRQTWITWKYNLLQLSHEIYLRNKCERLNSRICRFEFDQVFPHRLFFRSTFPPLQDLFIAFRKNLDWSPGKGRVSGTFRAPVKENQLRLDRTSRFSTERLEKLKFFEMRTGYSRPETMTTPLAADSCRSSFSGGVLSAGDVHGR